MSAATANERQQSRILFVKNLNYNIQGETADSNSTHHPNSNPIDFPTSTSEFHFHFLSPLPSRNSGSDLYELFGRYGAIRQIRLGDQPSKTKGTAYIVFEEVQDAKSAVNHLNGFHLAERYIVGWYTVIQVGFE